MTQPAAMPLPLASSYDNTWDELVRTAQLEPIVRLGR